MTTITQERNAWNAVTGHPTVRRREQWGARRSYTDARAVNEPATRVFIHISITNPTAYHSYDAHARAIESIGILRFPNTGISYNRMFMAGSTVVREGQPIGRRGAHTVNDFRRSTCSTSGCPGRGSSLTAPSWNLNYNARAYVWCANVGNSVPDTVVELIARAVYTDYRAGFITKSAAQNIHGHRCVSAKSCPGDRMWARMKDIQGRVNQLIAGGPPSMGGTLSEEVVLSALRKFAKEQQSVSGLAADTLPPAWNTSLFYLAAYGAMPASPEGRVRQATTTWNHPAARANIASLDSLHEKADALIAAHQGLDQATITELLERHHAERSQTLNALATQLDTLESNQEQIRDLIEQVGSGELEAERAVELVRERLAAAGDALSGEPDEPA